jgi:hypothetical protein
LYFPIPKPTSWFDLKFKDNYIEAPMISGLCCLNRVCGEMNSVKKKVTDKRAGQVK